MIFYFRKELSKQGIWSQFGIFFRVYFNRVNSERFDSDIYNSIVVGYCYNLFFMIVFLNKKFCIQYVKKLEVGKGGGIIDIRGERGKNCRLIIYN